jgi:large subunit ribosomal protein L25
MEIVAFTGHPRADLGKKASKAVRREGLIPAVIYGSGDPLHFSTTWADVRHAVYTPEFKIIEVTLDGAMHRCIVKTVQYHPVSDAIAHIDFLRLSPGMPVKVEVPVRFKGVSPGVRAGGKLLQLMRRVQIKATPENLVNEVTLDISKLELGQSIRVRDIEATANVEIMANGSIPVATIEIPRALRSAAAAAAASTGKKK